MPSGKVHDRIAIMTTLPMFLIIYVYFDVNLIQSLMISLSAMLCQLIFSPDLDTRSLQYKRWGFLKWIWIPYAIIFKHRSRFSHGLFFGPITRLLYLIIMGFLLFLLTSYLAIRHLGVNLFGFVSHITLFAFQNLGMDFILSFSLLIIAGVFIGTAIHTISDKIQSFFKNII